MREGKRPDRPCREAILQQARRRRGRAEGDRQGDQGYRRRSRQICRRRARARSGRALHRRAGGELLMAIELKMPALSPTMEEGTLAKWLVKEGDEVKSRRHPRRDRDRQGDDGVRGGRRGHDRQDPGPRRHRRGEGRHRRSRCWRAKAKMRRRRRLLRPRRRRPKRRAEQKTEADARAAARPRPAPRSSPRRRAARRRPGSARRHRDDARPPSARRCATRWPRKCAATSACS